MKDNEYKKIKYYLYNYKKLAQKIAEREEDIIDGTNVGHNAWIKGINCETNSLENQAIKLMEDKKLIELKRWQVFLNKRRIYPQDTPYGQNCRYPSSQNCLYPMDKNVEENNIITNNINTLTQRKKKFAEKVFLYDYEYEDLVKVYGKEKTHNCIYELDLYKKEKGVEYYSDYDAIKRWVVKRVDEQAKKTKDVQFKNTQTKRNYADNYEQREYSDDYWHQFYIN